MTADEYTLEKLRELFASTLQRFEAGEIAEFGLVVVNRQPYGVTVYHRKKADPVMLLGALDIAKSQLKAVFFGGQEAS